MGGSSESIDIPKANYTKDIQKLLTAYQKNMPGILAFEQQFRPQLQGLNLGDISSFLRGTDTQQGIWGLSQEAAMQAQQQLQGTRGAEIAGMTGQTAPVRGLISSMSPESAQAVEQQRQLAQRAGSLESEYGTAFTSAAGKYAPDIGRLSSTLEGADPYAMETLRGVTGVVGSNLGGLSGNVAPTITGRNLSTEQARAMADEAFARRGQLSQEEMRNAQQAAREASAASGRIGSGSQFAAEVLNREQAKAARRGEAYQAVQQAFGQTATAAQEQLAREQSLYGQRAGNVEREIGLRQAQYGQLASDVERNIGVRQGQYEQQAGNIGRNLGLLQGLFGQNLSALQQQEAAKQTGMGQFFAGQAGLQSMRGEQAGYYGGLSGLAGSNYLSPGLSILGSQPLSYQTGQQQLGLGLGAIGAGTPQLFSPDAALNLGAAERQNIVNAQAAQAQANAASSAGLMGGLGSAFNGLAGGIGQAGGFGAYFSDRRIKTEIKRVGYTDDGLPVYTFKYKGSEQTVMGVMAQDVEKVKPEAVTEVDGIKAVYYDMIQ